MPSGRCSGLIEILRSPVIQRSVKPSAITAIGEVALAIGPGFQQYLPGTMEILSQAGSTTASTADMVDFVWTMREAIVDAFIGIMNGLKATRKPLPLCPLQTFHLLCHVAEPFRQYISGIMGFLRDCWGDEDRSDQFAIATLGLIGDFGDTYRQAVASDLLQPWVSQAVTWGRTSTPPSRQLRANAAYASKVGFTVVLAWQNADAGPGPQRTRQELINVNRISRPQEFRPPTRTHNDDDRLSLSLTCLPPINEPNHHPYNCYIPDNPSWPCSVVQG